MSQEAKERSVGDLMPLLTVEEVAEVLRVCSKTVHNLVKRGELPVVRVAKDGKRFDPRDIMAYIERRKEVKRCVSA